MTSVQWLFHYQEVMKFKDEKVRDDVDTIKALLELYNSNTKFISEAIIEGCKLAGAMSNPEAGKALLDAEKLRDAKADIGDDEFADWWEDFSSRIPQNLHVEKAGDNVDLEGDAINLEKIYEMEMEARKKMTNKE